MTDKAMTHEEALTEMTAHGVDCGRKVPCWHVEDVRAAHAREVTEADHAGFLRGYKVSHDRCNQQAELRGIRKGRAEAFREALQYIRQHVEWVEWLEQHAAEEGGK